MTMVAAEQSVGVVAHQGLMSIKELAVYLKKSVGWVYVNKDELPHRKIGRIYFFDKGAIDDWFRGDRPDMTKVKAVGRSVTRSVKKKPVK
jgi:hypothetical protein